MAAISLAVFTVIAGLTAYFTSGDLVTNSFRAATLAIRVVEPNWIPNPTVVPEQIIAKDPYIDNIDETPAYVFMEVTVPAEEIILEHNAPDAEKGKPDSIISVPLFRFVNKQQQQITCKQVRSSICLQHRIKTISYSPKPSVVLQQTGNFPTIKAPAPTPAGCSSLMKGKRRLQRYRA